MLSKHTIYLERIISRMDRETRIELFKIFLMVVILVWLNKSQGINANISETNIVEKSTNNIENNEKEQSNTSVKQENSKTDEK